MTTNTVTTPAVPDSTKLPRATRKPTKRPVIGLPPVKLPRRPPAPVTPSAHVIGSDGRLAVLVPLQGIRGKGHHVTLATHDWHRISTAHGGRWTLQEAGPGHVYVVGQGTAKGCYLARLVARAEKGQTVMFRDGNVCNLARGNLEVLDAAVAMRRVREAGGNAGQVVTPASSLRP